MNATIIPFLELFISQFTALFLSHTNLIPAAFLTAGVSYFPCCHMCPSPSVMDCNFYFLEHSVQCPPQFCIYWDFARAELSRMITLCVIYYIAGSSLLSPPLFSAYTVVSYSIFNFLPSLDFSFQSVVWFVFCLIDFKLILNTHF